MIAINSFIQIGPNFQDMELVEDISVQCNSDIDCPIGLICEKSACGKPGSVSIGIIKGIQNFLKMYHTFDILV